MRELKFRVWSIEDKKWDNPSILEVWNDGGKLEPFQYIKTGHLNPIYMPLENYIIQQYTGLKDKNGKDIYEGDIISCYYWFDGSQEKPTKKSIIEVKLKLESNIHERYIGGWDGTEHFEDIEVIGNIFENPTLLDIPEGSIVNDNEELEDEDLEICDQCEENGWDGYICHYCGAKNI